jgi:hypothetical protein
VSAAGATLIAADENVSPWISFGFSILFMSFAVAMLNNDQLITSAARFIVKQPGPDAKIQREWEQHLSADRNVRWSPKTLVKVYGGLSNYAVPAFGAVAASVAFLADDESSKGYVAVPAVLAVLLVIGAVETTRSYTTLVSPDGDS